MLKSSSRSSSVSNYSIGSTAADLRRSKSIEMEHSRCLNRTKSFKELPNFGVTSKWYKSTRSPIVDVFSLRTSRLEIEEFENRYLGRFDRPRA